METENSAFLSLVAFLAYGNTFYSFPNDREGAYKKQLASPDIATSSVHTTAI
jgi:hypothetical protein